MNPQLFKFLTNELEIVHIWCNLITIALTYYMLKMTWMLVGHMLQYKSDIEKGNIRSYLIAVWQFVLYR